MILLLDWIKICFFFQEESSFDEQFLRHLTEAAHRRCLLRTRDTPIPSDDPTPSDMPNLGHNISAVISHVQHQNANPTSPADTSNGSRYIDTTQYHVNIEAFHLVTAGCGEFAWHYGTRDHVC